MDLSPEQAQGLAMFLIPNIDNEISTTKKILAAVPQAQLGFTLGDKGRSAKDLAWHIVTSDIWFTDSISSGEFGEHQQAAVPDTIAEIVAKYESGMAAGMAKLKAMSGAQLVKSMPFFGIMNFPAVVYLQFLNNHMIHHRGQLSTYIRAMNAHVPSIYGGSADEPFTGAASA
jgi:uncharacterized damage-inducible protein DinB